ncbi:MAG TPA: ATP synthase F1 subunit delta [Gemmatimonadales bacterium]|nr:ATP synthase F1 subunit delta [Gemmatimonadales bacterium]
MRESSVPRNYAQALFESGGRSGEAERFGQVLEALAGAIESDERLRIALESPRVPRSVKEEILRKALTGRAPERFVRFIGSVVRRGRQALLPAISRAYQNLMDVQLNRVHAGIALARKPDQKLEEQILRRLTAILGKEVVPHFREDPSLIGGMLVRVEDRVMDGSVRRQMAVLRRKMLGS